MTNFEPDQPSGEHTQAKATADIDWSELQRAAGDPFQTVAPSAHTQPAQTPAPIAGQHPTGRQPTGQHAGGQYPTGQHAPARPAPPQVLPPQQPRTQPPAQPMSGQWATIPAPASPAAPSAPAAPPAGAPVRTSITQAAAAPPTRPAPARQPTAPTAPQAPAKRVGMAQSREVDDLDVDLALRQMAQQGASDLHLTAGAPPMVRLDGKLSPLAEYDRLTPESLQRSLYAMLTQAQRERFEENLELDFSHAMPGESRFRVNMYRQRDAVGAVFRVIPYEIKELETLGIPPAVEKFAQLARGLVLVTGPTGSGKSTTLASLVDMANRTRQAHIVTVEDPIEFLHRHKRSLVNQREVGSDTHSFSSALKHVLRQDPDIILIGEMRDLETIQVALTAAETGHLVFATLHTQDAAQTIDRVIDVFPAGQQGQIRTQLATAIQGVVCQTLLRRGDGPGRAVAVEVMVATPAIRNLIREGKTHQIYTSLQAGASQGMQSMDQHLAELVKSGAVAYDVAVEVCHSVEEFNRLAGRIGRI